MRQKQKKRSSGNGGGYHKTRKMIATRRERRISLNKVIAVNVVTAADIKKYGNRRTAATAANTTI